MELPEPIAAFIGPLEVLGLPYCVTGSIAASIYGEPRMTRFLARELSTAHWFDLTAARRDFGYAPTISLEEGLRRLQASFRKGGGVAR